MFSLQGFDLPIYNLIHDCPLLGGSASQIDAGGLYTFMSHQIGKQCNIIEAVEKILCKAMPKRVRINDFPFQTVLVGKVFQLLGNTARGYALAEAIEKYISTRNLS